MIMFQEKQMAFDRFFSLQPGRDKRSKNDNRKRQVSDQSPATSLGIYEFDQETNRVW